MGRRFVFMIVGAKYHAALPNESVAEQIAAMCPFEAQYARSGSREYYARLPRKLAPADCPSTANGHRNGIYLFEPWNALSLVMEDCDVSPYRIFYLGDFEVDASASLSSAQSSIRILCEADLEKRRQMAGIITVYYSLAGQTVAPGMKIVDLAKGHTAAAAEFVQKAVGGDLFELKTVKEYNKDHMQMICDAKEELEEGVRPELRSYPDLDGYDTVFLGFPTWWNTLPMPVVGFLEHYDWQGKRIIPFGTSGGSGFGRSLEDLEGICAGADFGKGAHFPGHEVETSEREIADWARAALG